MGLKFIDSNTLSNISNAIKQRLFEDPNKKYSISDMIRKIDRMGIDMGEQSFYFKGGVMIPPANPYNLYNAYNSNTSMLFPACGDNVINMCQAYYNCSNLIGNAVCGDNVTDMSYAYYGCNHQFFTGLPVCGDNVVNMSHAYDGCRWLMANSLHSHNYFCCGRNVVDMSHAYRNCVVAKGKPICGDNVVNMAYAYTNCYPIIGPAVCGSKVTDMSFAYFGCSNLKGNAICCDNVVNMSYAYANCRALNGSFVFGNSVEIIYKAFFNAGMFNLFVFNVYPISGSEVGALELYNTQRSIYVAFRNQDYFNNKSEVRLNVINLFNINSNNLTSGVYKISDNDQWFNNIKVGNSLVDYIDYNCGNNYLMFGVYGSPQTVYIHYVQEAIVHFKNGDIIYD